MLGLGLEHACSIRSLIGDLDSCKWIVDVFIRAVQLRALPTCPDAYCKYL